MTLGHELRAIDAMNDSESWAHGSKCYKQLKTMIDMNNLASCELKALDTLNNSGLWMIWMILGLELKDLDALNNSGL